MGKKSEIIFDNTIENISKVGCAFKANGWYGTGGLISIAAYIYNLQGRLYVEGSLALSPTDDDWFNIPLDGINPYIQFPKNPAKPTGPQNGDSGVYSWSFYGNYVWIRARLDRDYLLPVGATLTLADAYNDPSTAAFYGAIDKILLNC